MAITIKPATKSNQDSRVRKVLFKVYFDWKKNKFKSGINIPEDWLKFKQQSSVTNINIDDVDPNSKITLRYDAAENQTNIVVPNKRNFGNGKILSFSYNSSAQSEIIKLIFLNYEINPDGTSYSRWIVYGSTLKSMDDALSGSVYDNGYISFFITEGTMSFKNGDEFTVYPAISTKLPDDTAIIRNVYVEGINAILINEEYFRIDGGPDFFAWDTIEFIHEGNIQVEVRGYLDINDSFTDDYFIVQSGDYIGDKITKPYIDVKIRLISNASSPLGSYAKIANIKFNYTVKAHTNNKKDESYDNELRDLIGIRLTRTKQDILEGYSAGDIDITLNNNHSKYSPENNNSPYYQYINNSVFNNIPVYVELGFNEETIPKINAFCSFLDLNADNASVTLRGQDLTKKLLKKNIVKGDLGYRNWKDKDIEFLIKILSIDAGLEYSDLDIEGKAEGKIIDFATFKSDNIWKSLQDICHGILYEIFINQFGKLTIQNISATNNKLKSPKYVNFIEILSLSRNSSNGDIFINIATDNTIETYLLSYEDGEYKLFSNNYISLIHANADIEDNFSSVIANNKQNIFRINGSSNESLIQQLTECSLGSFYGQIIYHNGQQLSGNSYTNQKILGIFFDSIINGYYPYQFHLYNSSKILNTEDIQKQIQIYNYNIAQGQIFQIILDQNINDLVERGIVKSEDGISITKTTQYIANENLTFDPSLSFDNTWRFLSGSNNSKLEIRNDDNVASTAKYTIIYSPARPFIGVHHEFRLEIINTPIITNLITLISNSGTYTIGDQSLSPDISLGDTTVGYSTTQLADLMVSAINQHPTLSLDVIAYKINSFLYVRSILTGQTLLMSVDGNTDFNDPEDFSIYPITDINYFLLSKESNIFDDNSFNNYRLAKLISVDQSNEFNYQNAKFFNEPDLDIGRSSTFGNIFWIGTNHPLFPSKFYIQNINNPVELKFIEAAQIPTGRKITRIVGISNDYFDGLFIILVETKLLDDSDRKFFIYKYETIDQVSNESIPISTREIINTGEIISIDGDIDNDLEFYDIIYNNVDHKTYISFGYDRNSKKKGRIFTYKNSSKVESDFTNNVGKPLKRVIIREPKNPSNYIEKNYDIFFQRRGGFAATTAQIWAWFSFNRNNEDKLKCSVVQEVRSIVRESNDPTFKFEVPLDFADFQYIFIDGLEVAPLYIYDRSTYRPANLDPLNLDEGKAGDIIFEEPIPFVTPNDTVISLGKGRILKKYFGKFLYGTPVELGNNWSSLTSFYDLPYKSCSVQVTVKNAKTGTLLETQTYVGPGPSNTFNLTTGSYTTGIGELHVFINNVRTLDIVENSSTQVTINSGLNNNDIVTFANRVVTISGARLGEEEITNEYFIFSDESETSAGELIIHFNQDKVIYNKSILGLNSVNAESVRDATTYILIESTFEDLIPGIDLEIFKNTDDTDKEQFGGDGTVSSLIHSASVNISIIDSLQEIKNITLEPVINSLMVEDETGYVYSGIGFTGKTVINTNGNYDKIIPDFIFKHNKNISSLKYSQDDTRVINKVSVNTNRREISPVREYDARGRIIKLLLPERIKTWEELYNIYESRSPLLLEPGDFSEYEINFSDPIDNNGLETNLRFNTRFVQSYVQSSNVERDINNDIIFLDIINITDLNLNDGLITLTLSANHTYATSFPDNGVRIYDTNNLNNEYIIQDVPALNQITIIARNVSVSGNLGKAAKIEYAYNTNNILKLFTGDNQGAELKLSTSGPYKPRLILSKENVSDASTNYQSGAFINSNNFYINEGVPNNEDINTPNSVSIKDAERSNVEVFTGGQQIKLNRIDDDTNLTDFAISEASLSFITASVDKGKIFRLTEINPTTGEKEWRPIVNFTDTINNISNFPLSPSDNDLVCVTNTAIASAGQDGTIYQYILSTSTWVQIAFWHNKIQIDLTYFITNYFPDFVDGGSFGGVAGQFFPSSGQDGDMILIQDVNNLSSYKYYRYSYNIFTSTGEWRIIKDFGTDLLEYDLLLENIPPQSQNYPIIAANSSSEEITISGDYTALFTVGKPFIISGSTGNNGIYSVASSVFSTPNTIITVNEDIVSNIGDGNIQLDNLSDGICRYTVIQNKVFRWNNFIKKWEDVSLRFIRPYTQSSELPDPDFVNDYIFDSDGNIVLTNKGIQKVHESNATDIKTIDIWYPERIDIIRRDIDKNTTQSYNGYNVDGNINTNRKLYSNDVFGKEYGVLVGGFHLNVIFPKESNLHDSVYLRIESNPNTELDAYYDSQKPGIDPQFAIPFIEHILAVYINKIEMRGLPIFETPYQLATIKDQSSIDEFGENSKSIENNYIQNTEIAKSLARSYIQRYAYISPTIDISGVGNVEIELGDTISIEEQNSKLNGDLTTIVSITENLSYNGAYELELKTEKIKDKSTFSKIGFKSLITGDILGLEPGFIKPPPPVLNILQVFIYPQLTGSSFPNVSNIILNQYEDITARSYHTKQENNFLVTDITSESAGPALDLISLEQTYNSGTYSPGNPQNYALTGYYESKILERSVDSNGWLKILWGGTGITLVDNLPNIQMQYRVSNTIGGGTWSNFISGLDQEVNIVDGGNTGSKKRYLQFRFIWFTKEWNTNLAKIKDVAVIVV